MDEVTAIVERQVIENPCCDCEESGMSMTCRCKDRIIYDRAMALRELAVAKIPEMDNA